MHLRSSYNKLVQRVDAHLRARRQQGKWEKYLPESIFDPHLWLWERESVACGIAWGGAIALTPIPMQTIAALLICITRRANVPMGVCTCWITIPGYQVIVWPLQWMLGASLLSRLTDLSSGATWELMQRASSAAGQGFDAMFACLCEVDMMIFALEFLMGCLISSACVWLLFYGLVKMLPKRVFPAADES